ncbi:uncharacterized protein KY384_004128 [Bacidia gigantensis]|uniref:uncharacterized protein n=1 Tax=Bacidia gigantensis TaxID=2732470 RepID=UPI001D0520D7|nr:uncharacterized protein KY384_004128 [Bacidia gigantensis]KAG8530771.1 hypothetical protein KY384_004128 [Bacidia gigantensis]
MMLPRILLRLTFAQLIAASAIDKTFLAQRDSNNVQKIKCDGEHYTYESLAGYGFVASDARDRYGDTLGGFGSSIALDRKSWQKSKNGTYTGTLWALPDRGWNTQGTLNYQNRIQKFSLSFSPAVSASISNPSQPNLKLAYVDTILLTGPGGVPTTGLDADVTGSFAAANGFPILPKATYTGDGFGGPGAGGQRLSIDSEGLVLSTNSNGETSFWVSDEYGPYIYKFNSQGKLIQAIKPPDAFIPNRNGSVSFSAASPPIYNPDEVIEPEDPDTGRANNQGLEGLSASADGKTLYALLQSALDQDGGPDDPGRKQSRLLMYDISSGSANNKAEYVVTLPTYVSPKNQKIKVAAQSEIHSLGNDEFLVLARDSGSGRGQDATESQYRHADIFSIKGADNIKSKKYDKTDGDIANKDGDLKDGIKGAKYCSFLDFNVNSELGKFGLHNGGAQDAGLLNEKWESLALVPVNPETGGQDGEWFLLSVSDNDFITQNGYMNGGKYPYKDESGFDVDSQALVFRVKLPKDAAPS